MEQAQHRKDIGEPSLMTQIESLLGRMRQISREVAHVRNACDRLESKIESLDIRMNNMNTSLTAGRHKGKAQGLPESDKENQLREEKILQDKPSVVLQESIQMEDNTVARRHTVPHFKPILYGFSNAESAIRKVRQIRARQSRGTYPEKASNSRASNHVKDPKGYWKLDFTDTSTQSP